MRLLHTFIQALLPLLLITSCDKPIEVTDDGADFSNEGFVMVDSTKYEMTQLIVQKENFDPTYGGNWYQIYLLNDGFTIHLSPDQELDSVSGIGNYTEFRVMSQDTNLMKGGEYLYSNRHETDHFFISCDSYFNVEFGDGDINAETSANIAGSNDGQLSIQNISTSSITFGISGVCVIDSVPNTPYQVYYSGGFHFEALDE